MKRILSGVLSGVLASVLAVAASAAMAQSKPPLKLGGILDMSGLYADITGTGSETAAKMAAEDFGGEVLGRKIEIIAADHLNKADLSANIARDMLDNQGVDLITDVPLSSAAFAIGDMVKAKDKVAIFTGGASADITGGHCGPTSAASLTPSHGGCGSGAPNRRGIATEDGHAGIPGICRRAA